MWIAVESVCLFNEACDTHIICQQEYCFILWIYNNSINSISTLLKHGNWMWMCVREINLIDVSVPLVSSHLHNFQRKFSYLRWMFNAILSNILNMRTRYASWQRIWTELIIYLNRINKTKASLKFYDRSLWYSDFVSGYSLSFFLYFFVSILISF